MALLLVCSHQHQPPSIHLVFVTTNTNLLVYYAYIPGMHTYVGTTPSFMYIHIMQSFTVTYSLVGTVTMTYGSFSERFLQLHLFNTYVCTSRFNIHMLALVVLNSHVYLCFCMFRRRKAGIVKKVYHSAVSIS